MRQGISLAALIAILATSSALAQARRDPPALGNTLLNQKLSTLLPVGGPSPGESREDRISEVLETLRHRCRPRPHGPWHTGHGYEHCQPKPPSP